MPTPEFIYAIQKELPKHCRYCDKLLNLVDTRLVPLYEAGKIDSEMVRADMVNATLNCGGLLDMILRKGTEDRPWTGIGPSEDHCYFQEPKPRLITED